MIVIHHNKDMDGYASGAICKLKYPDAILIGWDYKDPIPCFDQFRNQDVIMIDITFPINRILELNSSANSLTIIDHHISFKKDFEIGYTNSIPDNYNVNIWGRIKYIYEAGVAACEIGWKYLFPDRNIPWGITLIGRYDTWRQKEGNWEGETLPFKYYMYGNCNSAASFPQWVLDNTMGDYDGYIYEAIQSGKEIMKYQRTMDEASARNFAFEKEAFGLRGLCMNQGFFSSETLRSVYDPNRHDIMIGFVWTSNKWSVSLRSAKDEVDVSIIAKSKGGGGHKGAAGFEVKEFEDIFKK